MIVGLYFSPEAKNAKKTIKKEEQKMSKNMKKTMIAVLSALLALTLASCGTFGYNIKNYVDVADYGNASAVSVSKAAIDKKVTTAVNNLVDTYTETKDVKEGTIKDGNTVYIYYEGTLVLFEGDATIKVGESGVKGLDEALKAAEFKEGKAEFDLKLAEDFTMPAFTKKADESEDTTATGSTFASKDTHFALTIEGKEGKVTDGEELKVTMYWTLPGFEGGTYNAETEAAQNATTTTPAETSETTATTEAEEQEEEKKKGFELKIGSKSFIDGFESGLIGVSVAEGTKKTLNLTFPNPYSSNTAYSGMRVDFDVTVLSVTEEVKRDPATAEGFAAIKADYEKKNGEGSFDYADLAAYKAEAEKSERQTAAVNAVLNASKIKRWPLSDYNTYLENTRNQMYYYYYMMAMYGYFNTFSSQSELASNLGMTDEAYEQYLSDQAGASLKQDLVLYQVARDQGLDKVSDDEFNAYCEEKAIANGNTKTVDEKTVADVDAYVNSIGDKDTVVKQIVLERAREYLGEHVAVV